MTDAGTTAEPTTAPIAVSDGRTISAVSDADVPPNVRLIGGEMRLWTDDEPSRGRVPAGGPLLLELVGRVVPGGRRVLVAGPHDGPLVDDLAARSAEVVCLTRSLADACDLGRRHADASGFGVLCGSLDHFAAADPFDAIVALDGLDRLPSPDDGDRPWAQLLARLTGALAPGGVLLLGHENEMGLHHLVDARPRHERRGDEEWRPLLGYDPTRPTCAAALSEALAGVPGDGPLGTERCYAAFPDRNLTTLLVRADVIDTPTVPGAVAALAGAACEADDGAVPLLSDPRALMRDALRGGLGARLAPRWVAVARRGGSGTGPLPDVLVADPHRSPLGSVWELGAGEDGRHRRRSCSDGERRSGRVVRVPALLTGTIGGACLEDVLIGMCAHEDLPRLRALLRAFGDWLAARSPGGVMPGELVFATADNVLVDGLDTTDLDGDPGGGLEFALLDSGWRLAEPVDFRLGLTRILRRFALRLLSGGHRHPWPLWTTPDGIVVMLTAMCGHPVTRAEVRQAVPLEAEITAAWRGADGATVPAPASGEAAGEPRIVAHRELAADNEQLRSRLLAAEGHVQGLETLLKRRERELQQSEQRLERVRRDLKAKQAKLKQLRSSLPYRIGSTVTRGPRKLYRFTHRG